MLEVEDCFSEAELIDGICAQLATFLEMERIDPELIELLALDMTSTAAVLFRCVAKLSIDGDNIWCAFSFDTEKREFRVIDVADEPIVAEDLALTHDELAPRVIELLKGEVQAQVGAALPYAQMSEFEVRAMQHCWQVKVYGHYVRNDEYLVVAVLAELDKHSGEWRLLRVEETDWS